MTEDNSLVEMRITTLLSDTVGNLSRRGSHLAPRSVLSLPHVGGTGSLLPLNARFDFLF